MQVGEEVVQVFEFRLARDELLGREVVPDIHPEFVLFEILVGQAMSLSDTSEELTASLQAEPSRVKGTRESTTVHGHDETEAFTLGFVFPIELGNVFLDPVVQGLFVGLEVDPLVARLAGGNAFLEDATFPVPVKQIATVAPHECSDGRVVTDHLVQDLTGVGLEFLDDGTALDCVYKGLDPVPCHGSQGLAGLVSEGGVDLAAGLQEILHHSNQEGPVSLSERVSDLLEESQEILLAGTPSPPPDPAASTSPILRVDAPAWA